MITINKQQSNTQVNANLKSLRKEDKELSLLLRKVYTNISEKEYAKEPTTSEELLAVYNGKEDITDLDASTLLLSVSFVTLETPEDTVGTIVPVVAEDVAYEDMCIQHLTNTLLKDLGGELTSEIVNMTTGLKVKLDMLDELKSEVLKAHGDIRPEILTARLANALALTKEAKGSSLHTTGGNLAVYKYLNSDKRIDSKNYLFMADIEADATASLDILVLDASLKSYKAQVALGALPIPPKELILAVSKAINGIVEVNEDNKEKVLTMKFS